MQIKKLTPNLIVHNVEASLKFYREVLGLETAMTVPEQSPYVFAGVSNGTVEIFFNDQKVVAAEYLGLATPIRASLTLYMEVDSLQAVLERVQKAGAKIAMPVTEQLALSSSSVGPDYFGARLLLKPGRKYEEAVKTFQPYDRVQEPNLEARAAGRKLIAEGKSNQEISAELYLALNTVKRHAYNIYTKLEVKKRTHAVSRARQLGLIP